MSCFFLQWPAGTWHRFQVPSPVLSGVVSSDPERKYLCGGAEGYHFLGVCSMEIRWFFSGVVGSDQERTGGCL
jgi:hypothetical protein